MVQFINMPQYQPSPLLDLSPLAQGLQMRQRAQQMEAAQKAAAIKFAEEQRQFNATNALQSRAQARADEKSPYEMELLKANTAKAKAQAGMYSATARMPVQSPPAEPVMGMRPDGTVYEIGHGGGADGLDGGGADNVRVQRQVLGSSDSVTPSQRREHLDFGQYGVTTPDVPGLVTRPNKSRTSDKYATEVYQGQRALDDADEVNRQRLVRLAKIQQLFRSIHGDPGKGNAYTPDGKIIPIGKKESVQDRQALALAGQGLDNLNFAENTLLGKPLARDASGNVTNRADPTANLAQRVIGDDWTIPGTSVTIGGFGEGGRGFRAARAAVVDLNFAISGKSVSNEERKEFMKIYMPYSTDSAETKAWKMESMRNFFGKAIAARKAGADDDEIAGLYRGALLHGLKGQIANQELVGQRMINQGHTVDQKALRMKNKYGLE